MPDVLASALPEKPVISADGRTLGIVYNLTMDHRTGELVELIVQADDAVGNFDELERTGDGHLRVPANAISGLDDQLVVSLPDNI